MSDAGAKPIRLFFHPRHPRAGPRARAARWALFASFAALGCGADKAPNPTARPAERAAIREAKQAVTTAQPVCLSFQRGIHGTIADTQIANKAPPKNYGTSEVMGAGLVSGEERQT